MKNANRRCGTAHQIPANPTLQVAQLCDKVGLNIQPASHLQKLKQLHVPTIRIHHFERRVDNTLVCKVCGQKLPLTRRGRLDKEQFVHEISLRQWDCCFEQCQL